MIIGIDKKFYILKPEMYYEVKKAQSYMNFVEIVYLLSRYFI